MSDIVIVTGAASGLGAVYCRALSTAGYTVIGADVELARCDDLPAGPGGKFRHLVPLAGEVAAAGSPAQEGLAERAASPGCRRSL